MLLVLTALGTTLLLLFVRSRLDGWATSALERMVALRLGGELEAGRLHLRPSRLELIFSDVELRLPRHGNVVHVARGRARITAAGLLGLAGGRVRLEELELERPVVSWVAGARDRPDRGGADAPPIVVRIGRLEVREGRLAYDDHEIPWELTAAGVGIRAGWNPLTRSLVGSVELELATRRPPFAEPLPLEVRTRFRLRRHDVEIEGLQARGAGVEATFDGNLRLLGAPTVVGRGEATVDLDRLYPLLRPGLPRLGGQLTGTFDLEAARGATHLHGEIEATEARFDELKSERLRATTRYTAGRLELVGLRGQALGGEVTGSIVADFRQPGSRFRLSVEGRGLDAAAVFGQLRLPLPVAARVDGELKLEGTAGRRESWVGSASFVATPSPAGRGAIPLGGRGELEIDGGRLRLHSSLEAASASLTADLETDLLPPHEGRMHFDGSTRSARDTQMAVLRVAEALQLALPDLARLRLAGAGEVEAAVGLGGPARLDLGLRLVTGRFGRQRFDRAELAMTVTEGRVKLSRFELARGGERLSGSALLRSDPLAVDELSLVARGLESGPLLSAADLELDLEARIDASLSVRQGAAGREGGGRVRLYDGTLAGERFEEITSRVSIGPTAVEFDDLFLHAPGATAGGSATWWTAPGRWSATVSEARLSLAELESVRARGWPLEGRIDLVGEVGSAPAGLGGRLIVDGRDLRYSGRSVGDASGAVVLDGQAWRVELTGADGAWIAEGRIGSDPGRTLDARLSLHDMPFALGGGEPAALWGHLRGQVTVRGPLRDVASIAVEGRLEGAELRWGVEGLRTAARVAFAVRDRRLQPTRVRLIGGDTDVELLLAYDLEAAEVEASLRGRLDFGLLAASWPELRAWGAVDVSLDIRGSPQAPVVNGRLDCTEGRLRWLGFPQALDALSFRIDVEGGQARLRSLRGRLGNGELRGSGEAEITAVGLEGYELRADVANVRLSYPEGFRGIYEGNVYVEGRAGETTLGGRLTLLRGLYDRDFELTGLDGVQPAYGGPVESDLPGDLFLDLAIVADSGVWVRNDMAELETGLDLHLGGSLTRPQLTGRVWVVESGRLTFRDVEYRVTSGGLEFVELDRIDPNLTLRAETTVGDYTVFLRVEKTMGRLDYELTSDPPLSPQNIIALLVTGDTLDERASSGVGGDVATRYFSDALASPFEKGIQRTLGLETVRIDPFLTEGESDPTTRLTVGEEVADDLYVIVSTDLSRNERQLYEIDWRATNRMRLSVQRDTQGGLGGDIRYTDRFWWHKPPPGDAMRSRAERDPDPATAAGAVVASVRVTGTEDGVRELLRRRVPLEPGRPFSRSAMFRGVEAIKRYHVRQGRLESRVDAVATESDAGVEVVYLVQAGPPVRIEFAGTTDKERRRLRALLERLWVESVFSEELYDDAVARIREFFHASGHYAVDVRVEREAQDEQRVVRFKVDRGSPVRVEAVTIHGAEQIPEERLRSQMLTRPSSLFSRRLLVPELLDKDVAGLRSLYRSEGFVGATIEEPTILLAVTGDAAEVEIEVREGQRYQVAEVSFPAGLPFGFDRMREWADLEVGQVYSPGSVIDAESRLRSHVDELGYPDVRVRSRVEFADARVRVHFDVQPGDLKHVAEVSIEGNRLTRRGVVARELQLSEGDPISLRKLLMSQHRLYRLGIFRNVRLSYVPLDPDDPGPQRLEVRVEEAAPLATSVGIGWDTEADGKLSFSLTHENLGGHDRVLSVQGKFSGLERRLVLVGTEPRLFKVELPTLASVGWEEEEEEGFTVARVTTALRVDRRLNPRWTAFARYSLQEVELSDVTITPQELEEEKLVEGRLGDAGLTFVRDTRDDPFLTRKGSYVTLGTRVFSKPLGSEFTFVKSDLSASVVRPTGHGTAVASSVRVGLAVPYGTDGTVPISEAYFAGGDSTIRGFPRDEVGPASGGEAMLILNEEFRFPIWRSLKGVVFYDAGNVYVDVNDVDATDLREVLGAGLRLETPIGPIRLEYGGKLDREPGESIGELFLAIGWAF